MRPEPLAGTPRSRAEVQLKPKLELFLHVAFVFVLFVFTSFIFICKFASLELKLRISLEARGPKIARVSVVRCSS